MSSSSPWGAARQAAAWTQGYGHCPPAGDIPRPQQRVQGSSCSCFLLPPLPQTLLLPPAPQRGQLGATAPGQEQLISSARSLQKRGNHHGHWRVHVLKHHDSSSSPKQSGDKEETF